MQAALPRVTVILKAVGLGPDLSVVAPAVLEAARQRGIAVHEAIEAAVYGYLEPESIDPTLAPYLDAWLKFVAESGFQPIAAEFEVRHPLWRYCGHPDVLGWLLGKRFILDVKTGDAAGAEYQVAAYVEAWNAERPAETVAGGAILHLRADGMYRFDEVTLPAAVPVWYAAVVVYRAQQEGHR